MKNNKSSVVLTAFITFFVTSAMYLGSYLFFPATHEKLGSIKDYLPSLSIESGDMGEVKSLIDKNFINEPDEEKLNAVALKGYVAALGDAYSEYYTKAEYTSLTAELTGKYKGIGIEVGVNDKKQIVIITAYKDAPAHKAGLKSGDILDKVNGKHYAGDDLDTAVSVIKNAKESVTITVIRDGKSADYKITPEEVNVPCAESEMLADGIGYIRLYSFSEDANEVFRTHVNKLVSSDAKSLIIDLRDNPGGMLTTVVDIADLLLPEGNILTIKGRNTDKEEFLSGKTCLDIPLCVLINGGSASASEVLAGALKDHKRAVLVGEKSFGKGLVQSVFELDSGAALKLTTAKYYTPSGVCIDGEGITPDHVIEWKPDADYVYSMETDSQLQKAIELMK